MEEKIMSSDFCNYDQEGFDSGLQWKNGGAGSVGKKSNRVCVFVCVQDIFFKK